MTQPIFPDARFIIIRRRLEGNMRSTIGLSLDNDSKGKPRRANVISTTLSYYHHQKWEEFYRDRENVLTVSYEGLKSDTEATVRKVCAHVGVDFDGAMLDTGYAPNTSFAGKVKREQTIRTLDRLLFALSHPLIRRLPLPVLHDLRARIQIPPYSSPRLLNSYFNLFQKELASKELASASPGSGVQNVAPSPLDRYRRASLVEPE